MEKNLTSGGVLQNIVRFSLPYLLSYFLQTLYGMADLFIIGQFSGTADITAVSIGSQVMHMLTVMIVGLAMGATITIGRAVGGEEHERAALAVGNSATLFMAVASTVPIFSRRRVLSIVRTCSRSTTEFFDRPLIPALNSIWVGSLALSVLLVMAAAITVGLNLLPASF